MEIEEIMKLGDNYQYSIATGERFNFAKGADAFRGVQTVLNLGILASPIDTATIKPTAPDSPSTLSEIAACTSMFKVDEVVKAAASVSGSYGGASGSLAASYSRNISISETSSSYIAFFRKSYGRVYINPDAKLSQDAVALLKNNARDFIAKYGKLYVSAYRLSKMFFGEVKIDAESMSDKQKMDTAVSASYKDILKVNGSFESDLQRSQARYSMSVNANSIGTNVPHTGISSVKDLAAAVKKVEEEADVNIATITEVTLSSWLHFADFARNVKTEDIALFQPELSPEQLNMYAANYERLQWMENFSQDCINRLDAKLVRQWKVIDKPEREAKLLASRNFAREWLNKLSSITEAEVKSHNFISNLTVALTSTRDEKITPALKIYPFTFNISLDVASDYDDYRPVAEYKMTLKVDPNERISVIDNAIDIDNMHSNCRHFHGHQHAKYTDGAQGKDGAIIKPKIEFRTWWDRTCGSTGWSNPATFTEDLTNSCQLDYNDTVRVRLKYTVTFGKLATLPSGLNDGVEEEEYVFYS
jgi:hypothetical protein